MMKGVYPQLFNSSCTVDEGTVPIVLGGFDGSVLSPEGGTGDPSGALERGGESGACDVSSGGDAGGSGGDVLGDCGVGKPGGGMSGDVGASSSDGGIVGHGSRLQGTCAMGFGPAASHCSQNGSGTI